MSLLGIAERSIRSQINKASPEAIAARAADRARVAAEAEAAEAINVPVNIVFVKRAGLASAAAAVEAAMGVIESHLVGWVTNHARVEAPIVLQAKL